MIKVDRADTAPTSSTPSGTIDAEAGTHFWLVRIDTSHTAKKPDLLSLGEKSILIDDAGARHPLFTFTSSYSNAGISDYALIFSLSDARKPAALEVASAGTFALPREQAQ